ncbi:lipase family protein [Nocardia stercoris]|uniref:Alpha/beta hydrolase n=1 Tax=Nocardia stercoris TaxID=2483361 RepID=A0A3M2KXW0_9NOCA|nr:lipase family protein [Nocardia stercoris]RMI30357.1 alpha/beta hydrolase [Nocardia stercoris]
MSTPRRPARLLCAATLAASLLATAGFATAGFATATPAPGDGGAPGAIIGTAAQPDGWHTVSGGEVVDYWTTASDGRAVPVSGALVVPPGPAPAGGWPIIAWDHGTSGFGAGCGGEAVPYGGQTASESARGDEIFRYFLAHGFAVVAPDYIGLGPYATGAHPYLELSSEGTATVDLVRAARAAHPELSRTWAVIGQSQGGHAALGASWIQATYAPELDFRGTVTIDPASDIEPILPLVGPSSTLDLGPDTTAFGAGILAGLRATHPEIDLDGYLSPAGRALLDEAPDLCLPEMTTRVAGLTLGDLLSRSLNEPAVRAAADTYLTVPTSGYTRPILILANVRDLTVPTPLHLALIAQFAAAGVDFRTVLGDGTHCVLSPAMWSAIDAWTANLLATPVVP